MSKEEDKSSPETTTVVVKAEGEEAVEATHEVVLEESVGAAKSEPADASPSANGGEETPPSAAHSPQPQPQQQIYIIQTTDGSIPMESAEVVVADDLAVYETVSALEQLSRGPETQTAAPAPLTAMTVMTVKDIKRPKGA